LITSRRLSVIDMPAMMASYFLAWSDGMMPSQSWATISHFTFMRLHSSLARSISKPSSLPPGAVMFQGA
jgi:hypothetical protein